MENEREEQKCRFFCMLIATLVANFLVNVLAGKAYILGLYTYILYIQVKEQLKQGQDF